MGNVNFHNTTEKSPAHPDLVKRKFNCAGRLSHDVYATGFERVRALAGMMPEQAATAMGIKPEAYMTLEQGKTRPGRKTIEAFCSALPCHPLDLQDEKAQSPLPRVMIEILQDLAANSGAQRADRRRAVDRLRMEHECAAWMMDTHGDAGLDVLKTAEGAVDIRTIMGSVDDDMRHWLRLDDPRGLMDTALDHYVFALDDMVNDQYALIDHCKSVCNRNYDGLLSFGLTLYGSNNFSPALVRMWAARQEHGFDHVRDAVNDTPNVFGPMHDRLFTTGAVTIDGVRMNVRTAINRMLDHVDTHITMCEAVKGTTGIFDQIQSLKSQKESILNWRGSLKTQTLLAWCENHRRIDVTALDSVDRALGRGGNIAPKAQP
ncbi:helix-turn-helix domain-containing protein [Micavibrio aeruginosavorus]|uniref:helix-turn-helix domain-containing protein n=1 Tax=Micavibrio aeruginosavorus TaxID=349221 RepID=UPI003F4AAA98